MIKPTLVYSLMDDSDLIKADLPEVPEKAPNKLQPYFEVCKFLKRSVENQESLLSGISNYLDFDDIDAVNNLIDEHNEKLKTLHEEIEYFEKNPVDLFRDWKPKKGKPKFRRYANNNRTNDRIRGYKIW